MADSNEGTGRFSAYDKDLTRYVGGVHDSRDAATKAAKAEGSKSIEVHEV